LHFWLFVPDQHGLPDAFGILLVGVNQPIRIDDPHKNLVIRNLLHDLQIPLPIHHPEILPNQSLVKRGQTSSLVHNRL
jgi:hypothetical protein